MLNTFLSSWVKCAWYNLPRYINDLSHCSTWFITPKESGVGCSSHAAGRNSRGAETQASSVLPRITQKGSYKTEVQTLVSQISSKYLEQGRPHRIGLMDSYFLRLSLFHAAKENDGWHEASYCACPFSDTLQFARHDLCVVYPNKNPCWEYMLTLSSGMWDWKKTEFSLSPESWELETAGPQLPLSHCQKQNALWGNKNLNMTAITKTTLLDTAVAWKGWYIKALLFIETLFSLEEMWSDGLCLFKSVLGCRSRGGCFLPLWSGMWYRSNSSSWKPFVIINFFFFLRNGSASGNKQVWDETWPCN